MAISIRSPFSTGPTVRQESLRPRELAELTRNVEITPEIERRIGTASREPREWLREVEALKKEIITDVEVLGRDRLGESWLVVTEAAARADSTLTDFILGAIHPANRIREGELRKEALSALEFLAQFAVLYAWISETLRLEKSSTNGAREEVMRLKGAAIPIELVSKTIELGPPVLDDRTGFFNWRRK